MERLRLTVADKVLIVISVCLIVGSYVVAQSTVEQGSTVLIQVDGVTVCKMSLNETRTVTITGANGPLTAETRGGKVAIIQASCPNHICVRTGWCSRAGEIIVCVPNKTVVRIISNKRSGIHATTG